MNSQIILDSSCHAPKVYDGLRLILQFYDNHGQLSKVEDCTGIKKDILQRFLSGKREFTPEERHTLENYRNPK